MINKKILVVYYSRSGSTRKVSKTISEVLQCDVEEIYDTKKREGMWGFFISARDAVLKKPTIIKETKKDSSQYDVVLIGTPIWAGNISCAVRTYINYNKDKFKKFGFFHTSGGVQGDKIFNNIEQLCNKKSIANMGLTNKQISDDMYLQPVNEFIANITKKLE